MSKIQFTLYMAVSLLLHFSIMLQLSISKYDEDKKKPQVKTITFKVKVIQTSSKVVSASVETLPKSIKTPTTTPKKKRPKLTTKTRLKKPRITNNTPKNKKLVPPSTPQKRVANDFLNDQDGQQIASKYAQQLKIYIEQNKVYPRIAIRLKHSGTVKIRLKINNDGTFKDIQIEDPSRFNTLNKAAIDLLTKLERFKPASQWSVASKEFVVPIVYNLRRKM